MCTCNLFILFCLENWTTATNIPYQTPTSSSNWWHLAKVTTQAQNTHPLNRSIKESAFFFFWFSFGSSSFACNWWLLCGFGSSCCFFRYDIKVPKNWLENIRAQVCVFSFVPNSLGGNLQMVECNAEYLFVFRFQLMACRSKKAWSNATKAWISFIDGANHFDFKAPH